MKVQTFSEPFKPRDDLRVRGGAGPPARKVLSELLLMPARAYSLPSAHPAPEKKRPDAARFKAFDAPARGI
jgi:hypothetical protein